MTASTGSPRPSRGWLRNTLLVVATMLLARPLAAQEAPEILRPQPIDTTIAGGIPAPTSSYPQNSADFVPLAVPSWDFFLQAGAGWEHNPSSAPTGSGETYLGSLGGGFEFQKVSPRSTFLLEGSGSAVRYQERPDLDRYRGRGILSLSRRFSPRSLFNLSSSTELADGRNSRLLVDSGLLYNSQVRTLSNWTSTSLDQRIGARSTFTVGATAEIVTFDDPNLLDGTQIVARASVSRQTSARTNLGANYSHRWSSRSGALWQTDTLFASFSGRPGQRSLLNFSGGASRSTVTGIWRPYGSAEYGLTTRRSSFTLRASTNISQAYGIGLERAVAMVMAAASRQLGQRASLTFSLSYSRSTTLAEEIGVGDPGNTGAYNIGYARASLEVPVTGHFGFRGTGFYQLRRVVEADVLDIQTGGVSVYMFLRKIPR